MVRTNTPVSAAQVASETSQKFNSDLPTRITGVQDRAKEYYKTLVKYYED